MKEKTPFTTFRSWKIGGEGGTRGGGAQLLKGSIKEQIADFEKRKRKDLVSWKVFVASDKLRVTPSSRSIRSIMHVLRNDCHTANPSLSTLVIRVRQKKDDAGLQKLRQVAPGLRTIGGSHKWRIRKFLPDWGQG